MFRFMSKVRNNLSPITFYKEVKNRCINLFYIIKELSNGPEEFSPFSGRGKISFPIASVY